MARYAPLWQQNQTYSASLDRSLFSTLFPVGGVTDGGASVVANTMNVNINAGRAAVPLQAGQHVALCYWSALETVTLPAAPGTGLTRIDLICIQVRDNALDSGGNNDFILSVVSGVASATPAPPPVPANALAIWSVPVPGGAANLNGVPLTDLRQPRLALPGLGAQFDLAVDVSPLTATAPQTLFSGVYTPARSAVKVDFSATGFNNTAMSRTFFQTITSPASQTRRLSAPMSAVTVQAFFAGGSALHTGLTPGTPYTFSLQGWVEASGSYRCRAATQPALENMRLIVSDA